MSHGGSRLVAVDVGERGFAQAVIDAAVALLRDGAQPLGFIVFGLNDEDSELTAATGWVPHLSPEAKEALAECARHAVLEGQ